jgi:hypothetical protein
MKPQARDQTQDVFLGPEELGFLARLRVEDKDRRVTDSPERVAGLDQAAAGEVLAVGAEREVAHASIIDPLPCRVVFGEFPRVARASLRDVDCEFASSRRRSWISFGYLG